MAQAETVSITNRRNFLVGAGIASAAIVAPLALAAAAAPSEVGPVSEGLQALGEDLRVYHQAWIDAGDHLRDVVDGLRRWEVEHPEPRPYDDEGNKLPASLWAEWNEEHKKALKRFGKLKALNAYQVASVEFEQAIGDVIAFQAITMTDLNFKAELALECDNDSRHLSSSVVEDLLGIERSRAVV